MDDSKKTEFLLKLSDLLKEYDLSIGIGYDNCSDMHGVYNLRVLMSNGKDGPKRVEIDMGVCDISSYEIGEFISDDM